jgi:transposase InsO family protein
MPWKIISLNQGRCCLVKLLFKAQKPVAQLCRLYGISRKTAYKWKARFLAEGRRGLSDRSKRPRCCPRQMSARWRRRIKKLRQEHPRWGARKIRARLRRLHPGQRVPAVRTITRWLGRWGLVKIRRRPPKGPVVFRPALTQARRPNQVWTVDFKGWWRTADGTRVEPLTVRDLFSRYVVSVRVLPDQQWWRARAVFIRLFRRHGLPGVIRVDNGGPFASTGPAGLSRLSAWWTALGIRVEFIRPGHPEDNGGHEQMHRILKSEAAHPPSSTLRAQQRRLNGWRQEYNLKRPHQALGERTPAELYRRSCRPYVALGRKVWCYPQNWETRRVRSNGQIRWRGRLRFIGEAFIGHFVGLQAKAEGKWMVYFGPIKAGELRTLDAGGLRPAAYVRQRPTKSKKEKV